MLPAPIVLLLKWNEGYFKSQRRNQSHEFMVAVGESLDNIGIFDYCSYIMNNNRHHQKNIFSGLITSKTTVRILMRLFLNPDRRSYVRQLSSEFGVSPSLVREKLQELQLAGLLSSEREGRQVLYRADASHALFPELQSMVRKALGMDRILESIVERLGDLDGVYLLDDYAEGKDTGLIDLLLVGNINQGNLVDLMAKTESHIGRKIRTMTVAPEDFADMQEYLRDRPRLLLWQRQT